MLTTILCVCVDKKNTHHGNTFNFRMNNETRKFFTGVFTKKFGNVCVQLPPALLLQNGHITKLFFIEPG